MDDRWARRVDKQADAFADHPVRTGAKWYLWVIIVVIILAVTGGIISWAGSWGGTARRLTGPAHSEQQITAVLDDWTGLQATAGNACAAAKSKNGASNDPQLVETPDFAYQARYRSIKADYDRRNLNLFEAYVTRKLPLPGSIQNLPRTAPTLRVMERQVC